MLTFGYNTRVWEVVVANTEQVMKITRASSRFVSHNSTTYVSPPTRGYVV